MFLASQFSYNPETKTFFQEVSTLTRGGDISSLMQPRTEKYGNFVMQGRKNTVAYECNDIVTDPEGDVVEWIYVPTFHSMIHVPECIGTKVIVAND